MSSKDVAVSVRGLSKAYTIARSQQQHTTAGEALVHKLKNPLQKAETDTFWALRDVSFDVLKGDVVGIIGRNGAGKSTLLKILSQITEPTEGEILLYGRVGSLLEVGTGFHPELTGRENIFLNGAILGMRKSEITRQFDAIVDFAEVEKFLDTPVKRYSSGMYVRLAFAVAAHLNPEILIVDEVLAVGDAEFQKKCLGKMSDVAKTGKTVLFVSHNITAVSRLCAKSIFMRHGQVAYYGDVTRGVDLYRGDVPVAHQAPKQQPHVLYEAPASVADEDFSISRVELLTAEGKAKSQLATWDDVTFRISYICRRFVKRGSVVLELATMDEATVLLLSTQPDSNLPLSLQPGEHTIDCKITMFPFSAGDYLLAGGLAVPHQEWLCRQSLAMLTVEPQDVYGSGLAPQASRSLVAVEHCWQIPAASLNIDGGP